LPDYFRELVSSEGIILNIDSAIPLTRSRRDFAHRTEVLSQLKDVFPEMIAESIIRSFTYGTLNLKMIPYDYFWKDVQFEQYLASLDQQILADAQAVNSGQSIVDWGRYVSKERLFELLTLIKIVEVGGEKRSLLDLNKLRHEGYDFSQETLPPYLSKLIKASEEHDKQVKASIVAFEKNKEIQTPFLTLNPALESTLETLSPAHLAFLKLTELITHADRHITQGVVCHPSPLIAAADVKSGVKYWNLLYLQDTVEHLSSLLKKDAITRHAVYSLIGEVIKTSTHEDAHFVEGSYHWASHHNEVFFDRQQRIWDSLLLHHSDVIDEVIELLKKSDPSMLDRIELAFALNLTRPH
jgi:hypothetical protein